MAKRIILAGLAVLLASGVFAVSQKETAAPAADEVITIRGLWRVSKGSGIKEDNLFSKEILERFNVNLEWEEIDISEWAEKVGLLFASGDYPEWIRLANQREYTYDVWGPEGYLIPFNEHWDKLPDYRKLYTDRQWEVMNVLKSSPDGNVYYLPVKSPAESDTWCTFTNTYRKKTYERLGLEFPETTEQLKKDFAVVKADNPDGYMLAHRHGLGGYIGQFALIFRTQTGHFDDPDAGGEHVYGPITDKFREMLVYERELYRLGYINPEFPTSTTEQYTADIGNGNAYFWLWYPGLNHYKGFNQYMGQDPETGDWYYGDKWIRAYEDKGPLVPVEFPSYSWGTTLTDACEGEELDRMMEILNWSATDEGVEFCVYGIKGVTYELNEAGVPDSTNFKDAIEQQGFQYLARSWLSWTKDLDPNWQIQRDWAAKVDRWVATEGYTPFFFRAAYRFTPEENTEVGDLGTLINEVRNKYWLDFIISDDVDPADDAIWNDYVAALKKAGFDRYDRLRKKGHEAKMGALK
jgi:putative aldouronate transport system substrate-binding protein